MSAPIIFDIDNVIENYGKFEELTIRTLNEFIKVNSLTPAEKAKVVSSSINNILNMAVQTELQSNINSTQLNEIVENGKIDRETKEHRRDAAKIEKEIIEDTKQEKINTIIYNEEKAKIDKEIAVETKDTKIAQVEEAKENLIAQKELTEERKTQLTDSVKFNNYAKALDYFEGAYSGHKMGGGTITETMWLPPFEIVKALATSDTNFTFSFDESNIITSE